MLAVTVAVRGTSHRIAISPMMSFLPTVATLTAPLGRVDQHVGLAVEDDVGGVAEIALAEQLVAVHELAAARW